jgi:hypothetical protein
MVLPCLRSFTHLWDCSHVTLLSTTFAVLPGRGYRLVRTACAQRHGHSPTFQTRLTPALLSTVQGYRHRLSPNVLSTAACQAAKGRAHPTMPCVFAPRAWAVTDSGDPRPWLWPNPSALNLRNNPRRQSTAIGEPYRWPSRLPWRAASGDWGSARAVPTPASPRFARLFFSFDIIIVKSTRCFVSLSDVFCQLWQIDMQNQQLTSDSSAVRTIHKPVCNQTLAIVKISLNVCYAT